MNTAVCKLSVMFITACHSDNDISFRAQELLLLFL